MEIRISEIIEKAKTGHQSAFTLLLDTYWNNVYKFMLSRSVSENDAEDITIETFAKAFDKIQTYNSEYEFSTWLIAIGKNVHIDTLRKKKLDFNYSIDIQEDQVINQLIDTSPSAEDLLILEQNLAQLLKYIKKLKPDYQEIIQLRYFKELSYKEICIEINEPLSNVKIKLLRARKLLAEIIQKKQ